MAKAKNILLVAKNKKAFYDYEISETYEAGISLLGYEVKSLRQKDASLEGSFVKIDNGQAYVYGLYIKPYKFHTLGAVDPLRVRKLLLKSVEIKRLENTVRTKGISLIALEIYFKSGWAKLKIGLCRGKKLFDKRQTLKDKDIKRELEKNFKSKYRL